MSKERLTETITIRLDTEVIAWLRETAHHRGISVSALMREIFIEWLEQEERQL